MNPFSFSIYVKVFIFLLVRLFVIPMSLGDIVDTLENLDSSDIQVLKTIEDRLERYEVVPIETLAKDLKIKPKQIGRYTEHLVEYGVLLEKNPGYRGFTLTRKGRDLLALHDLGLKGEITGVGPQLDVGKEGDIYIAYLGEESRILKLYRMERKTFKHVEKSRSQPVRQSRGKKWFEASWRSARREFNALKKLWNSGVQVPKPVRRSRHVIEMGFFDGVELENAKLEYPKEVFKNIILEIVKAVESAGIVHGELSAYNIMVNEEGTICLIDFPQYVSSEDPRASDMLEKDFNRLIFHFSQKYPLSESELYQVIGKILERKGILPEE